MAELITGIIIGTITGGIISFLWMKAKNASITAESKTQGNWREMIMRLDFHSFNLSPVLGSLGFSGCGV